MATEETAGGARKATKSKLFEFLVHGVVSGAVLSFLLWHASVWMNLCERQRERAGLTLAM